MRSIGWLLWLGLAACGDDSSASVDAPGSSWTRVSNLALGKLYANGADIYGTAENALYRSTGDGFGSVLVHPYLADVWGSGPTMFVVGSGGDIFHGDGTTWTEMTSGTGAALIRVWGTGPQNVLAGGNAGTMIRYDGTTWAEEPYDGLEFILGLWGTAADDIFSVGSRGTIRHFDGATWSMQPSGTLSTLFDVWGTAPDNVYAVGGDELVATVTVALHYDGTTWTSMALPTGAQRLMSIAGSAADDIWAVGEGGTVLHYDGMSWTAVETGLTGRLSSVALVDGAPWIAAPTGVYRGEARASGR